MNIKGNYLHLLLRRTKREIPYHENIGSDKYPEQNLDYLGSTVRIRVKDNYRIVPENAPEYRKEAEPQIIQAKCKIVRYDNEEPWVVVYVEENYEFVIVDSSLNPSDKPLIYANQYDKDDTDIIGSYGYIQSGYIYNDNILETFDFPGVVISSDISEPALDVIIGQYSEDEYKVFLSSEIWLNVKGNIITDPVITSKFKTTEVRRHVLEGKQPYGLNQNRIPNDEERNSEEG